ncbi:hypothetical protein GCM10025876_25290 [Demequina litorisediminis]|uniref:Glutamine amidotransferase n=1 Tax=Demequina litorisediminis TaxID=1849022 RepID=A0ABQ6IEQ0_9MICO|nr:hypothetical protein GCM10025876_25290 [Demequina litorisediminis]
MPHTMSAERMLAKNPAGIILSGGPSSVYEEGAPSIDPAIFTAGVPIMGICYGFQAMAQAMGGTVAQTGRREYGRTVATVADAGTALAGSGAEQTVWMSHGDSVQEAPEGFTVLATTEGAPVAAFENLDVKMCGVQWHPEVKHSPEGQAAIENFLYNVAGIAPDWTSANVIDEQVERIRAQVGSKRVICALSGGVDSAVAAALVQKAVGDQAHLHPRGSRPDACGRGGADREGLRRLHRRAPHHSRREAALPRRARGRQRPGDQAQDHRPRVHPCVRGLRAPGGRGGRRARRGRRVPGAGHPVPGRRRVRRRRGRGEHQEPPQRGRPSR